MRKNPLFYKKCNSNQTRIARAKRNLFLSIALLFTITAVFAISFSGASTESKIKGAAVYALIIAFPAGVQGKKDLHGEDESDEAFSARKGKAEDDAAFAKRFMQHEIGEAIKRATDEWKKELGVLKTNLEALKPNDTEGLEALKAEMRKHGIQIEALKDIKVGLDRSIKKGSLSEILAKNKAQIDGLISRKSGKVIISLDEADAEKAGMKKDNIFYKATQTSTDIANRNYYDSTWHEGGAVGQLAVRQPFLKELFKNQSAASEYIKYRDQATAVRDADNVALCGSTTHDTKLTWQTNTMQITKIRDFVDVCLDMMNDYSFVEGEIKNLINSSVQLKIDDQLLVGTGAHPQTNSLTSIASTWAANIAGTKDWTSTVPLANLVDLIVIAKSQIQELGLMNKFTPNYVCLNPGDYTSILLLKNSFGDGIKPNPALGVDMMGNITIAGMRLISNPNVTVDTLWIGDFTKGTVYNIPGVGIEMSYENSTNFETETVTVKAYERLNLLVRTVDTNAFMNIPSIATALGVITKP